MEASLVFTFKVDNVKITVDRALLLESSDVFKAMLESEMLEHEENTIIISDFKPDVILSAVSCLQNPDELIIELSKHGEALMLFANKYDIRTIQKPAEEFYAANISTGNAVKCLQMADQCGLLALKHASLDYISDNVMPILIQTCLKSEIGDDLCEELLQHAHNKPKMIESDFDILESTVVVVAGAGLNELNGEYRFVRNPPFELFNNRYIQHGPCFIKENVICTDDQDLRSDSCSNSVNKSGENETGESWTPYILLEKDVEDNAACWQMSLRCESSTKCGYYKEANPSMTELFPLPTPLSPEWKLFRDMFGDAPAPPPMPTVHAYRLPHNKISAAS